MMKLEETCPEVKGGVVSEPGTIWEWAAEELLPLPHRLLSKALNLRFPPWSDKSLE